MHTRTLLSIAIPAALVIALGLPSPRVGAQTQAPPHAPATPEWPSAEQLRARRIAAEERALFSSDGTLAITLTSDFKSVQRDRDPKSTTLFPATLSVANRDGSIAALPVRIRTRGHVRRMLRTCSFAPLRVEFDPQTTAGTVFEGQRALKLGTHCRDADLFEQYMPREYVAYRIFNLLTPRSFRARLVDASYVDQGTGKKIAERQALFIEDDDDVARRMGGRSVDMEKLVFTRLERESLTLMTLFEYMIGNTDVSIYALHNARLIQLPNVALFYPVPYDFDYSGLVNARYAVPAKPLNLTSVLERAYMGPCRPLNELEPFFERLRAVRERAMDIVDTVPGLSESYRKDARKYLDAFYTTINTPRRARAAFVDRCNKVGM
ncbi:MAG: hypothetical protein ABL961_12530 [Vicinamibacterales bacterium]